VAPPGSGEPSPEGKESASAAGVERKASRRSVSSAECRYSAWCSLPEEIRGFREAAEAEGRAAEQGTTERPRAPTTGCGSRTYGTSCNRDAPWQSGHRKDPDGTEEARIASPSSSDHEERG